MAEAAVMPDDPPEARLRKAVLIYMACFCTLAGLLWGSAYMLLGFPTPALIPFGYSTIVGYSLVSFLLTKRFVVFRFTQLALILCLPFLMQWSLGGFVASSAVILWALLAPIGALMFHGSRQAVPWFAAYLLLLLICGIADRSLAETAAPVPPVVIRVFFVMNLAGVSTLVFWMMHYFVGELKKEQARSEELLLNILPGPIVDRLKREQGIIADGFAEATVLFADIVDFTHYCTRRSPEELVETLNGIFTLFDQLAERHGLEKIKTIGDAYMVVAGVPTPRSDHVEAIAEMALDMQEALERFEAGAGTPFRMRMGINTGPVVAGVIGLRKFIYDLWGDAVNTASRMEALGLAGAIQVSAATYQRLQGKYELEERGVVVVKGKGEMVTYLLRGRASCAEKSGLTSHP
jgi:class 3 adenylate cyclase